MKLRIISGELRGRRFNVPDTDKVRPTTDRVRETVFNILNNKIDFEGISVLDLFSGSGAIGFESISRGASFVNFVENNSLIIKNLEKNIEELGVSENCFISKFDALSFSKKMTEKPFDLIYADPPYFAFDIYKIIINLKENNFISEETIFFIERSKETQKKDEENFKVKPLKIIGSTCIYEIPY